MVLIFQFLTSAVSLTPFLSVYLVDELNNRLYMEQIIGSTLKQFLWTNLGVILRSSWITQSNLLLLYIESNRDLCVTVAQSVGKAIGMMHDADVVHGDLTTSNFIVKEPAEATIIDFGLGMHTAADSTGCGADFLPSL